MTTEPNTTTAQQSGPSEAAIAQAFRDLDTCGQHTAEECAAYNRLFNLAREIDARQLQAAGGEEQLGDYQDKALAWDAVCVVLNSMCPGWAADGNKSGLESAVATIRKLAGKSMPPAGGFVVDEDDVDLIEELRMQADVEFDSGCCNASYPIASTQRLLKTAADRIEQLTSAPAAQVSPLSGGVSDEVADKFLDEFEGTVEHPRSLSKLQRTRAALQSVWTGQKGEAIGKDFLADHITDHLLHLAPVAYGEIKKLRQDMRMVIGCMRQMYFQSATQPPAGTVGGGS